jgi:hypothetical protein
MSSFDKKHGYILTIEEKWWNKFIEYAASKKIQAHVRSRITGPEQTNLVFFYVIHPRKEIKGYGEFVERRVGDSKELWNLYGHETCLDSFEEYYKLIKMSKSVTFIRFQNLHKGINPIPFSTISTILNIERMPRRGMYISEQESNELIRLLG